MRSSPQQIRVATPARSLFRKSSHLAAAGATALSQSPCAAVASSVGPRRQFSTIQRGHDKQRENLFEKLGFGKDAEAHRVRRTLAELEQGFVRQVQLLKDPVHDAKDAARLEELKEAYLLLRNENFRRNYAAHYHNSNDAQLHVLQDGGSVAANFNPEHQSFEFVDHAMLRTDAGRSESASLGNGSASTRASASPFASSQASTSFASTQEAYQNATGIGSATAAEAARAYNAATAKAPAHGADIPFLLKLSFEESLLGCTRQLQVRKHCRCSQCGSNGVQQLRSGASARRCPQCLGRGSLHLPSATYHIERKCAYCAGEGTVPPPPCGRCRGRGVLLDQPQTVSVVIPAGTFSGAVFRLSQKGHDGVCGGRAGDLVLTVLSTEHRHFYRVGVDLHAMLPLPLTTALLGGVVRVPTIQAAAELSAKGTSTSTSTSTSRNGSLSGEGEEKGVMQKRSGRPLASLRVPPCVRNGQILGFRQYGLRHSSREEGRADGQEGNDDFPDGVLGNIFYHVLVLVPKAEGLSGRQKAALGAYEAASTTAEEGTAASASSQPPLSPEWETSLSADAKEARWQQCASLKAQYKHWFTP